MLERSIPAVYESWSFATFPVAAAGHMVNAAFEQAHEAARGGTGLVAIAGGPGAGKTGLMVSMLRLMPARPLIWIDGFTLMVGLTEVAAGKRSQEWLAQFAQIDILCIDDLGYAISNETVSRSAATRALQDLLTLRESKATLITLAGRSSDQATYLAFCAWLRKIGRIVELGSVNLREQLFNEWEQPSPSDPPRQAGESAVERLRSNKGLSLDSPPVVRPTFTICFILQGSRVLLLNRRKPPFMGLWNGVGGKLETGESPLQSVLREIREETDLELPAAQAAGIVSWGGDIPPGAMHVFIARLPEDYRYDTPRAGREGILAWHELAWVYDSANEGVVGNIRRFLPEILAGKTNLEHRLTYQKGQLTGYEATPMPE